MPRGSFVILLPLEADYKVLGYHFSDKRADFEITSNLFLRLNLDHSKNEYNTLKLQDTFVVSYLHKLAGKLGRKASGIIVGLLLFEDDKPEEFREALKKIAEGLAKFNLLDISKEDLEKKLKDLYEENLESEEDIMDESTIKNSIINNTKDLLSGGKKQRKLADELLKKVEAGVHKRITELYNEADNALKDDDYEKASKTFLKAAEIAEEFLLTELTETLKEKAKLSGNVPEMTKNLDVAAQKARNFLKNADFYNAYIWYKKASEIAKILMIPDKLEEYSLKSKALQEIYQIEQKFKK
ncbi:MAG: hypothetical protein EU550_01445 [Promethearchaeota archaeon]|nr:MAG: hypothetical protein EU550_01445 [Candidatus Lokiarchaeota archaeon]